MIHRLRESPWDSGVTSAGLGNTSQSGGWMKIQPSCSVVQPDALEAALEESLIFNRRVGRELTHLSYDA